jgi:hypothetical protein
MFLMLQEAHGFKEKAQRTEIPQKVAPIHAF